MELATIQTLVSDAFEQIQTDQLLPFVHWLEDRLAKYRMSNLISIPTQSIISPKSNNGHRFICTCGRSFTTDITIRETTNVETSSPPATPMLGTKIDLKSSPPLKRSKPSIIEQPTVTIIRTTTNPVTLNHLVERTHQSNDLNNWQTNNLKQYENSEEFFTNGSTHAESDIELSSDESHCLEELDVLADEKTANGQNFIYSNTLWNASLSPSTPNGLSYSMNTAEQQQQQQQVITLKPVNNEPLSPVQTLLSDEQTNKTVVPIHRQPILIAFKHHDLCSTTSPTHFKCTQCHETFDSLLLGQEHVNNGLCISDVSSNVLDNSDSQISSSASPLFDSLQENMEEVLNTRSDSKAACPICNKVFSSVHTMIRHKTSIHDRQVRYECNICGRCFFRKDKLTSHMVYHQDFDTYVCCLCHSGFKSRMLMRQHLKRDHRISGEDTRLNEILTRCQVKKANQLQTNSSMDYITAANINLNPQQQSNSLKRTHQCVMIAESDRKPSISN